ncbi:Ycf66 family protein [Lyngbya aestuarii]|uniref:Ycf66 family protein n=1 Tax=Lyngbya aestuarii TaxID=118322 RepID=UPI00403D9A19
MLAYVLALAVGLGSFALYMAAFFFPEVHRKYDLIWSGVGLFYALVLWVCAGRVTGGVLLGQVASVALLGWLAGQTLMLRRELTAPEQQTPIPNQGEISEKLKSLSSTGGPQKLVERFRSSLTNLFGKNSKPAKTSKTELSSQGLAEYQKDGTATAKEPQKFPEQATSLADEASSVEAPTAEARQEITGAATTPQISETRTTSEESEIPNLPQLVAPEPAESELVEAANNEFLTEGAELGQDRAIPVEEIAPEAELAPPAEPVGDGDPQMRQNPPEPDWATEGVPLDPENPPQQS